MNFTRNEGFVSPMQQAAIGKMKVAIAGVGGDGGLVAEGLARLGFQHFALADPDPFEEENLNRQAGCTVNTIGGNKAAVLADVILSINPKATVAIFADGITAANVDQFVHGCDIVVDETEFTLPHLAVMLARAARAIFVPVITGFNVGFGCLMTSFQPDGLTLEEYLGLPVEATLEEISEGSVPLDRWIPRLPDYVTDELLMQVAQGERPAPSVFPGVAIAAGCVVTEIYRQAVGLESITVAPQVLWVDVMENQMETFKVEL